MLRSTILVIPIVILMCSVLLSPVAACTIFSASNGVEILVGNNEDWNHTNFSICFYPRSSYREYGYAAFVHSENYLDVRAGMNDQGVFIDATSVPSSNVTIDPEKPFLNRDMFRFVLQNCKSVNETIDYFMYYNIAETWNWQLLVADSNGDSVVIVAGPDEAVWYIHKNGTFQLITNGNIAYPELGQSASSEYRYESAHALLEQMDGNLSISAFRETLDAAHSKYTAFSSVYDLINRDIYIYFNHVYTKEIVFNLDEQLAMGGHAYDLSKLFLSINTTTSTTTETTTSTDTTSTSTTGSEESNPIMIHIISISIGSVIILLIVIILRKR